MEVLPYVNGVGIVAPSTPEAIGVAPDTGACGDGGMVGRAGDAMDGGGGTAVTSAAACVCVIGVERGESDGGDRVDIVFFCVSFSSTTVAHACIQDPRNKPTQVHMHIVRQYRTIQA